MEVLRHIETPPVMKLVGPTAWVTGRDPFLRSATAWLAYYLSYYILVTTYSFNFPQVFKQCTMNKNRTSSYLDIKIVFLFENS